MKPPEILSMIEEATGTSMYESKKESAQRMIEKKENKLTQINKVKCINNAQGGIYILRSSLLFDSFASK